MFDYQTNLTIYGYTNSSVEQYAKDHNISFVSLGLALNNVVVNNVSDKSDNWDAGYFTIKVGEKFKLDVTTSPEEHADSPFFRNWDSDIISINDNGVITGLKAGEATLSIHFNNNHKNYKFIVVDDYPIRDVTLSFLTDSSYHVGDEMFEIPLVYKKYELNIEGKSSLNDPLEFSYEGPEGLIYEIQGDKVILTSIPAGEYVLKIKTRDGITSKMNIHFKKLANDFNCPEEVYVPAGVDKVETNISLKSKDDYGYFELKYSNMDNIYFNPELFMKT